MKKETKKEIAKLLFDYSKIIFGIGIVGVIIKENIEEQKIIGIMMGSLIIVFLLVYIGIKLLNKN